MHNLVPHYILEKQAHGETHGQFAAATLFADISGFSAVTHALSRQGSEAAEVMADIMERIFGPLVEAVYAAGGFITGFAGDAFTAVFPVEPAPEQQTQQPQSAPQNHLLCALAAARRIQTHLAANPVQETPYGRFPFAIKLGLSQGRVDWGILIPNEHPGGELAGQPVEGGSAGQPVPQSLAAYYFSGPAVEWAAQAEHHAQPGTLVIAPEVAAALDGLIQALPVGDATDSGYVRLLALAAGRELPAPRVLDAPQPLSGQDAFVPPAILQRGAASGEFRQVITVFISLMGVHAHADLEPFLQAVFALQRQYGGYLARVDFGDKGCNLLLFWGTPLNYEDDLERALHFTLALGEHTPGSYRAGLTLAHMYAGLAGSSRRAEWTCYGDGINLAARLMLTAPWGSLWLDERLAQRAARRTGGQFVTEKVGEYRFKGFDAPQMVYTLVEQQRPRVDGFFRGRMIGHAVELARLEEFVRPLYSAAPPDAAARRSFAGILCVEGEAGLGKSRLVTEFLLQATAPAADGQPLLQWALLQTDPTVRAPFNAWRYWLRSYFSQSPSASDSVNKRAFGRALDGLVAATPDPELQAELNRGRAFLGALLDLYWDNSPYAGLVPEGRYELTLAALTALVRAESRRCALVIDLEDAHWLDEDSLAVVVRLSRAAVDAPFAILATARPVVGDRPLFGELPYQRLALGLLGRDDMAQLTSEVLGSAASPAAGSQSDVSTRAEPAGIDPALLDLLEARAEGNPFFAEQILLFLREQGGLLAGPDGWALAPAASETDTLLPGDVRSIFASRLDCLSGEVREVVQAAAILGREFEVQVLAEVLRQDALRRDERLPDWLREAAGSDIWSALTGMRYIFKHALMRDAAYEMQLRARRRELHRLAAEALESLYGGVGDAGGAPSEPDAPEIEAHLAEIAYHYQAACRQGLAATRLKAIDYLERAGQQAARRFENVAALQAYGAALELLEPVEVERRWVLLLHREAVYAHTGDRQAQAADLSALEALAAAGQRPAEQAIAALRRAKYGDATADYPLALAQAQAAAGWAQAAGRVDLEAEAHWVWGNTLRRQSDFPGAARQAQHGLALAHAARGAVQEAGDGLAAPVVITEADLLCLLGLIAATQNHDWATAREYFEQSLALCRQAGNRTGEAIALGNLATVQGDLVAAADYVQHTLAIFRATGNQRDEGRCYLSLVEMAIRQGNFVTAQAYAERGLTLLRATGDRVAEMSLLCNIAALYCLRDQPNQASQAAAQALEIAQQIGDFWGKSTALMAMGQAALLQGLPALAGEHFAADLAALQPLILESGRPSDGMAVYFVESQANLSWAALQQGDKTTAQAILDQALPWLAEDPSLKGADHPLRARLYLGQTRLALGDPGGREQVLEAHREMLSIAAALPDEDTRRVYLDAPEHRQLCALAEELTDPQARPAAASLAPKLEDGPHPAPLPALSPALVAGVDGPAEASLIRAAEAASYAAPVTPRPPAEKIQPLVVEAQAAAPVSQPLGVDLQTLTAQLAALLAPLAQLQGAGLTIHIDIQNVNIQQMVVTGASTTPNEPQGGLPDQ